MNFWQRLFNRKASEARIALSINQLGRPVQTPKNYEAFSKEGYQINVITYKCVSLISRAAASIDWFLKNKKEGMEGEEIKTHPMLDLLAKPNPMQGQAAFFEAITAYYMISGNSYIEAVGPSDTQPPVELWPLRPDKMRVIPGRMGLPLFYEFYTGQQKEIKFPVDQVTGQSQILHLKTFHPTDNWYGMSPIEAAMYSIDQHNESGKWNLSLLQNMATPSGVVTIKQDANNPFGTLPDVQYNNVRQMLKERAEGAQNAGRTLLLEGGLDWKQMGMSPKDMDWMEGRKMSARDIALAFGVPPILLNIPGDSTFNNYREARLSFYEDTVLPLMDTIRDELNVWLVPRFGENLYLEYDVDSIVALDTKRSEKFDKISSAGFLTINEKRVALGFETIEDGDVLLVNSGLVPLADVASPPVVEPLPESPLAETPSDSSADNEEDEDEIEDEDDGSDEEQKDFSHLPIEAIETKQINPIGKRGRLQAWKAVNQLRTRLSTSMEMDLQDDFEKAAKQLGKAVENLDPKMAEFAALRSLEDSTKDLEKTIQKHIRRAANIFGRQVLEAGKSISPDYETKTAKRFFDFLESYVEAHSDSAVTKIENTNMKEARRLIRKFTAEAVEEGTGASLSKVLEEKFEALGSSRAKLIARTEMGIASNTASVEAAKALDVPDLKKEWVSVQDARTRPGNFDAGDLDDANHIVMNGVQVGIDEKFEVPPGESMNGPGDDSASASNIINCRCVLVFSRN